MYPNTGLGGGAAPKILSARYVPDEDMDPLFEAVAQATEEAILNSMFANQAMTGRDGNFVPALPHGAVRKALDVG